MIRHSVLPKLQKCPCFKSAGGSSPAARRGTQIDSVIRRTLQGLECMDELSAEDQEAAKRGIQMIKDLVPSGTELETRESQLWVKTPGMDHVGTEDIRAQKARISFDVKSGQVYDYESQMAAYALGNMTRFFEPEWTCYLLFIDQNRVVEHKFTMDSATELVESIIKAYNDPNKKPNACQYCSWCAEKNTCLQVVKPTEQTLKVVNKEVSIDTLKAQLADPAKLGKFLQACNIFKKEMWDWAKEDARRRIEAGEEIPGWRISKGKKQEVFGPDDVEDAAVATGATYKEVALLYGGEISGKDFRAWAEPRGYFPQADQAKLKDGSDRLIEKK